MSLLEGILLGIVQGLTELLPVSSSAHLVFAQSLIQGFKQPGVLFDVVLHVGTTVAVALFFRREIGEILVALLPKGYRRSLSGRLDTALNDGWVGTRRRFLLYLIVATAITGAIGLGFKDVIHELFESVELAASMLLVTGILLFLSDRVKNPVRTEAQMNLLDGIVIGVIQGIAVLPGISRSGSTITFGLFRGLEGETAARFSFLLSIPAIAGAAVLEARHAEAIPQDQIAVYAAGGLAAAVVAYLTLKFLFLVVRKRNLRFFAYYCWIVGAAVLALNLL
ncbi:MAG: undecaprenyl-diphosphate phosphatase [Syntrophales bacterium]|nr:undecaprenyl-diphosphate phosphatase [Syntrophales bacterium]MCU0553636.1 undecaprenyl-diphosphate phosphatase [Syntrophales bacterium]MCU0582917.1 undecaprenyl-diphosphate phosphatase [Syntrophales bacterium]